jgi:hypothetical protein
MTRFNTKLLRGLTAALVFYGALLGIGALFLDAGICEGALRMCLFEDQEIRMEMPGFYVLFCLEGYAFCKKYIDPAEG